jgi:DNA gyrase subunit A
MELGTIRPVNLDTEMRSAYLDYAMSVIVARALPDVRDGLKPVQRRIMYAMNQMGLRHNVPYRKSAGIVGEVLKEYHPHGEGAVYDAIARMAQDFSLRYPLVDGQGNWGSVDGDPPAAMRYTEARLRAVAEELLADIEKETVEFKPNYDEKAKEPTVLPGRIPNLLLNGAAGIAVGMATNIPPHNLTELANAIEYLIDNPDATVEDLMKFVPGPDFPTGGIIVGNEGIQAAYATGKGRVVMRAKAYIEESKAGRYSIVVTELPFQVNKATLHEKIAELIHDDRLPGAHLVRDESDRNGMRLVIELKRDAQPKKVLNLLFKYTAMQSTFGVNMLALVNGNEPRVLTLKKALQHHVDWRVEVITKRTQFELRRAQERAHVLEGLKIALDHLDAVIATIRQSRTTESAKGNLREKFKLSDVQAQAILDMRLARLAALERKKIEDEYVEVIKQIGYYEDLLAHPKKIFRLIKDDLKELKEKYADERRTRIIEATSTEFREEDLIPDMQVLVTITDRGYIKRLPHDTYKRQNRGGKGIIGMVTREMDAVQHMITCNTLDNLLFLTNKGKVYQLKAHEVPDAARQSKGLPLVNLVSLEPQEQVTGLIAVRDFKNDGAYLILATRQGKIKKTPLSDYSSVRSTGIIALNLEPGDELAASRLSHGNGDVIVASRKGQAIRFAEQQVRSMGRATAGVAAIRLRKGDEVVGMDVVRPDSKASLLIVTSKGIGKRTRIAEFPRQGRAGGGVRALTIVPRGGDVTVARVVNPDDDLVVISTNGQVIRMFTDGIPHKGRPAQGVAIMNTRAGDEVASIARIPRTDSSGKMISDDDLEVLTEEDIEADAADAKRAAVKEAEAIVKMPKLVPAPGKDDNKPRKSDGATATATPTRSRTAKPAPKAAKKPTPITGKRTTVSTNGNKTPVKPTAAAPKTSVVAKQPTPITSKKAVAPAVGKKTRTLTPIAAASRAKPASKLPTLITGKRAATAFQTTSTSKAKIAPTTLKKPTPIASKKVTPIKVAAPASARANGKTAPLAAKTNAAPAKQSAKTSPDDAKKAVPVSSKVAPVAKKALLTPKAVAKTAPKAVTKPATKQATTPKKPASLPKASAKPAPKAAAKPVAKPTASKTRLRNKS